MYKQCRTEQSAARQRILEQGLLEAMSQRHYDTISVSDLCAQMGIPRKSFYRYFSSKEGALHALLDHALLDFESTSVAGFSMEEGVVYQNMVRMFQYWRSQEKLLNALAKSGLSGMLAQRAIEHTVSEIGPMTSGLSGDERLYHVHAASFVACGLFSMVVQWHHSGYPQSPEQMARIAVRLVSRPLFSNGDKG